MQYKLVCNDYIIFASNDFVNSCKVFINMFEDTGNNDNTSEIPVTNSFSKKDLNSYINFFEELNGLYINNNNNKIKYLDYIINYRDEFIENYTNKDKDPPHMTKLMKIFNKTGEENILKFIEIDKFYDNNKIRIGVMLCLIAFVRSVNEYNNIEPYDNYLKRKEQVHEIIKEIMNNAN